MEGKVGEEGKWRGRWERRASGGGGGESGRGGVGEVEMGEEGKWRGRRGSMSDIG